MLVARTCWSQSTSSQEVDLSVAAQLRALRHYADSVRMVDRPQFQRMLDEAAKPEAPF